MTAQITISLDIPEVRVMSVEQNERGECTITVESTIEGTRCRLCGRELKELHGVDEAIKLRHLPILGRPVYLRLRPKRYRCPDCEGGPTTTQQLSWYTAEIPDTKTYEKHILLQLVHATIEDISIKEELGAKAIEEIVERWISREVQWTEVKRMKILGLDEIALKKGHRDFVVIVTGKATSGEVKVLAVLPDRKKQTVKQFLERMPAASSAPSARSVPICMRVSVWQSKKCWGRRRWSWTAITSPSCMAREQTAYGTQELRAAQAGAAQGGLCQVERGNVAVEKEGG